MPDTGHIAGGAVIATEQEMVFDVQELNAGNQATVCGSKRRIRKTLWYQREPLLKQVVINFIK